MISFISSSRIGKALRPLLAAASVILSVETFCVLAGVGNRLYATNFFPLAYVGITTSAQLLVYTKLTYLIKLNADMVIVGDSSALHGLQPNVMNQHMPIRALNMACCGNTGFAGYQDMAEAYLRQHPGTGYVMLHVSPHLAEMVSVTAVNDPTARPMPGIHENFVSPWRHLIPASIGIRLPLTNFVYWHEWSSRVLNWIAGKVGPLEISWWRDPIEFRDGMTATRGFFPLDGRGGVQLSGKCALDPHYVADPKDIAHKIPAFALSIAGMADMAARYGARLVVVVQPTQCETIPEDNGRFLLETAAWLKRERPTVHYIFPVPVKIRPEEFNDMLHLTPQTSVGYSEAIAAYLARNVLAPPQPAR